MTVRICNAAAGVLVACTVACTHGHTHRPGEEWLAAIHFAGNHAIHDASLLEGLSLHRALDAQRAPDPYQVELDGERIRGRYVRKGYLDASVTPDVQRAGDRTTITFAIVEGARANAAVAITGLDGDPALAKRVRDALPVRDGAPFDYEAYDRGKDAMLGVMRDAGYAHAQLAAEVHDDAARHVAQIAVAVDLGPRTTFGEVQLKGVSGRLARAVRDRLAMAPGDQYSQRALVETRNALYGMRRFSTVRVEAAAPGGDGDVGTDDKAAAQSLSATVPVEVDVVESSRHEVKLGGGVGIDPLSYEVRGRAGYTIVGWPIPLETVTIDLRPAYARLRDPGTGEPKYEPRMRALAQLEHMDFLGIPLLTGIVAVGYNYLTVESYTTYGPLARLGVAMPLGVPQVQLRVGWRIEEDEFRHIDPLVTPMVASEIGLHGDQRDAAYEQALIVDLRDNALEPTRGGYLEARVSEGTTWAGGQLDYVEVTPEARGYLPVGAGVVLAGRVKAGTFYGDVPVAQRFYAGGASSNRGFSERRLSPTLVDPTDGRSIPIGGGTLVDTGAEVRFPMGRVHGYDLGGVVFLDGGDVTNTRAEMDLGHLNWAGGTGLRLMTPIGPLRFDLAKRLNRTGAMDPEPGSTYAFHLSIGEAF